MQEKLEQLTVYLQRISDLATTAGQDPLMRDYFNIKRRYWQLQQEAPPPLEARQAIEKLKGSLRSHYLSYYQSFYDILFVDRSGFVLSTVRTQGEYHKNLFEEDLARTALARRLHEEPGTAFVDYEFYWVSDEPSAFFVEPLEEDGVLVGWMVLQCALNRINEIFSRGEELGKTGETFLVNRRHQMLTESRLSPGRENSLRSLARENIEAKFKERRGHKRVIDYRGYPALTSFTVCPVLGSEWLLVAKIDEDEVLTRHFLANESKLKPQLLQKLAAGFRKEQPAVELPDDPLIVDMDEFRLSRQAPLLTFGVATCTALVITLPGGDAYLGHASVHDRIYGAGDMDVLGQMLRRVRQFEIHPYQLRDLRVVLVAPHLESLSRAVDILLEDGLLLSQIRFLHDPSAEAATVLHDLDTDQTVVRWTLPDGQGKWWQHAEDAPSLAETVKSLVGYR